jgi:bilirubin oxidase
MPSTVARSGATAASCRVPQSWSRLLMAPAERADVIVDFTRVPVGTTVTLLNIGPDSPFGGGEPNVDFPPADPQTTGAVMQFRVRPSRSIDRSAPPETLALSPAVTPQPATARLRRVSLNELDSSTVNVDTVAYLREQHGDIANLYLRDRRRNEGEDLP